MATSANSNRCGPEWTCGTAVEITKPASPQSNVCPYINSDYPSSTNQCFVDCTCRHFPPRIFCLFVKRRKKWAWHSLSSVHLREASGVSARPCSLMLLVVLLVLCQTVSGASQCNLEPEVVRQRRLAAIKQQILSKLGMTEAPNDSLHSQEVTPDVMKRYRAAVARRKRRSLEQSDDISSDAEHYHAKRITLVPVSPQGKAGEPIAVSDFEFYLPSSDFTFKLSLSY